LFAGASTAVPIVVLSSNVSATAVTQAEIIYVQKSAQQKTGPYVEYEASNGTDTTQTLSLTSGPCWSSTLSNPASSPLLPITASYYPKGYSSPSTTASVGSAAINGGVAETGVCSSQFALGYTIQPDQGLVFSLGQNPLTQGQLFSQATIPLKNNLRASVSGAFVLRRTENGAETVVDTVPFTLPPAGTESQNDTNDCPDTSTVVNGQASPLFDQLEVQVDSPSSGSVSVTGPNCDNDNDADDVAVPTFYLDSAPAIPATSLAAFTVGTAGSDTVTATGYPTPTVTDTSSSGCTTSLPTGLSFTSGSGTGTLSGTPAASTGGTYTLCVQASNAVSTISQVFTFTVDQAPGITSANNTTFVAGSPGTFTVTTSGFPTPTLSDSGFGVCSTSLPTGVSFTPNGNGTATITGTPALITSGAYTFTVCISASNGIGTPATQTFTLTVDQAPAITSETGVTFTSGSSAAMTSGVLGSFTVTTTGNPPPALTDASFGSGSCTASPLPNGVTFVDDGNGTATISGTPANGTGGTYTVCINATNVLSTATQTFTLTVDQAPAITSADTDSVLYGTGFSFLVTTSGYPYPTFSVDSSPPQGSGCSTTLPGDLTLTPSVPANGMAALAGTSALATGTYCFQIDASNGVGTPATQVFTLTVNEPPAITSYNDAILPLPATGSQPATFPVTATGSPTPALSLDPNPGGQCLTASTLPTGISFADSGNGSGIWSVASTATAGTYCFQIDASNGVSPMATQAFTLVVTSPTTPYQATVSAPKNDPVAASIALNSGLKSFSGFDASQSALGSSTMVTFTTEGASTFTATVDVDFGDLTYCVPYGGTGSPVCQPTQVTIGESGSTPTDVLPCSTTNMPSPTSPATYGWCSESDSYSYPVVGGVQYTSISQVLFGAGDVTFSHA
jgi:hypothetical protein